MKLGLKNSDFINKTFNKNAIFLFSQGGDTLGGAGRVGFHTFGAGSAPARLGFTLLVLVTIGFHTFGAGDDWVSNFWCWLRLGFTLLGLVGAGGDWVSHFSPPAPKVNTLNAKSTSSRCSSNARLTQRDWVSHFHRNLNSPRPDPRLGLTLFAHPAEK